MTSYIESSPPIRKLFSTSIYGKSCVTLINIYFSIFMLLRSKKNVSINYLK